MPSLTINTIYLLSLIIAIEDTQAIVQLVNENCLMSINVMLRLVVSILIGLLISTTIYAAEKPVPKGARVVECWKNECWLYEPIQIIGNGGPDGLYIGPDLVPRSERARIKEERELIRQCAVEYGITFISSIKFGAPINPVGEPHETYYTH